LEKSGPIFCGTFVFSEILGVGSKTVSSFQFPVSSEKALFLLRRIYAYASILGILMIEKEAAGLESVPK
jgi:hypothetical protein